MAIFRAHRRSRKPITDCGDPGDYQKLACGRYACVFLGLRRTAVVPRQTAVSRVVRGTLCSDEPGG